MLSQLSVKNLAVVEKLELSFSAGMSTVTGETGAGKSILLQALSLALGVRADSGLVRHGKDRAEVSAVFAVENNAKIQSFLQDQALDDDGECVLRRVVSSDSKSKAFINGSSVPLSIVRTLGDLLIDMHGQNEHQLLLRPSQQLDLLDSYAQINNEKQELNLLVDEYKSIQSKIDSISNNHKAILQQQELYTHQLGELNDAQLDQDELDNIESDFKQSSNAQELIEKTLNVLNKLDGDGGINSQLSSLNYELSQALELDNSLLSGSELLNSAQLQTQESVYELTNYLNSLSVDEQRSSEIESRISELHDLGRKHNCQIVELLNIKTQIEEQLEEIGSGESSINELTQYLQSLQVRYELQAKKISKIRLSKAKELSALVTQTMQVLGMPGSEFKLELPVKKTGIHLDGNELVGFLIKTNMGQDFKALNKVASGGELSRISLAISVVGSSTEQTPTLVFDEVDVGISGAVAEIVGRKLRELSTNYQVICITHLAQVAAFGHQHLRVSKAQEKSGAQTEVLQLSDQDRIDEVARILGGAVITDKARNAAAEMIQSSQ